MTSRKDENTARTRALLEKTARPLFEGRGYASVSAEEIVAEAGLTRGALYHHYAGKQGLFEAVAESAMQRLHEDIVHAGAGAANPMAALCLGIERFVELASTPRIQQLLFVDAPGVLGWQRWRALDEQYGLGMLKRGIEAAIAAGQMRPQSVDMAAHILVSGLIEAAMVVAHARNKATARKDALDALLRVLAGLA